MSRKYQNRSNFNTYQNRVYNNDINLKDINTQKNLVNNYEEMNHYNNIGQNDNNLLSNFGENNWSRVNHGRDVGEKYDVNPILKNQANYRQNNYSNNNRQNRNYISTNYNNNGRNLGKISDVNPLIKNQANYRQNNYSNNNQPNRNSISPDHDKHSNENNLNNNLNKENHRKYLNKNFNVKPEMKKLKTPTGIGFNNLPNVSIKNNNDNLQQKDIDIVKENKNLEENKKAILNKSPEISTFEKEVLKVCIYIYFYEKILKEKNIFVNSNQKYYLINKEWVEKFKEFTSYTNLEKVLASSNYRAEYNNLDSQINIIIDYLINIINPKFEKDSNQDFLNDSSKIMTSVSSINKITFTNEGIIYPSKIIEIIKNLYKGFGTLQPKEFIFQNNFIYYINKKQNKIIISHLGNDPRFIPKYVFAYNTKNFFEEGKNNLISSPINEYIKQFNCEQNIGFHKLMNNDNIQIGNLIILKDPEKVRQNQKNVQHKKAAPKQNNINKDNNKQNVVNNNINDISNQNKKKENELINL